MTTSLGWPLLGGIAKAGRVGERPSRAQTSKPAIAGSDGAFIASIVYRLSPADQVGSGRSTRIIGRGISSYKIAAPRRLALGDCRMKNWSVGRRNRLVLFAVMRAASAAAPSSKLERGKVSGGSVALCGDCHTPHTEKGESIQGKIPERLSAFLQADHPIPGWRTNPQHRGFAGLGRGGCNQVLYDGLAYNELPGRPPCPIPLQ